MLLMIIIIIIMMSLHLSVYHNVIYTNMEKSRKTLYTSTVLERDVSQ